MIFPPARPAAAAAAAGSRASRWGGWQQQQRAGVARSGQVSFGHLYGALRPPCWPLCALGAVEVLTTANPSPPPPQGPGPAGTALCGSIGPGAWRGGPVSGPPEGNSRQEAPGGAPPRRGWAPPAGLWGPQGHCPCPFLVQPTRPDVSSSAQTQGRSLHTSRELDKHSRRQGGLNNEFK